MKRSLSLMLAVCLILTFFAGTGILGSASAITYADVASDYWARNEIYYLTDKGILEGDGTGNFRPSDKVTHIEFIKMIVATFNLTDVATVNYTNVPGWAKDGKYLEKASAQGFLLGYSSAFDFSQELTRQEAVALVTRYLELDDSYKVSSNQFNDYSQINSAYRDYVLTAVGAGIIFGYENSYTFNPEGVLSRSEALAILYRAAGAIYTQSASSAETGASSTNATINRSVTLSNINLKGNVYITEGVDVVTLVNCSVNGNLIVRGDTKVYLEDTVVTKMTVNSNNALVSAEDDSLIEQLDVNATATVKVEEDSVIKKLLFNNGSKNSTVTGEGAVTYIAIQDSGITTTGVEITEYYIYKGYTAEFDSIKYTEGTGKPVKSIISSAAVGGGNTANSTSNTIYVKVTAKEAGTVYIAAWPKNLDAMDAAKIKTAASSANTAVSYGIYGSISANTEKSFTLTVGGAYTNYNVGIVVLPTGTTSTTGHSPYYNSGTLTSTYASMVLTAPVASISNVPTYTLTSGTDSYGSYITLTFDQILYVRTSSSAVPTTKLSSYSSVTNYFNFYKSGTTGVTAFTATASDVSGLYTVVTIRPNDALVTGNIYNIYVNTNVVSSSNRTLDDNTITFTHNASGNANTPSIYSSNTSNQIYSNSYIYITLPANAHYVSYQLYLDNSNTAIEYYSFYSNHTTGGVYSIDLGDFSFASTVRVVAQAYNSNGIAIGSQATATFTTIGGDTPIITVNNTSYRGTGNTVPINFGTGTNTYTVSASLPTGYSSSNYTLYMYRDSTSNPSISSGTTTYYTSEGDITFIAIMRNSLGVEVSRTTVVVDVSNGSVSAGTPTVTVNGTGVAAGGSINVSKAIGDAAFTVTAPANSVGITYKFTVTYPGGASGTSGTAGDDGWISWTQYSSATITVTAVNSNSTSGIPFASWTYTVNAY